MKLYWRYKKDGKWTWKPAERHNRYTDAYMWVKSPYTEEEE